MEKIEIEVYSQASNQAVIKMPHRRFPGVVIQGDTLSILRGLAQSINEKSNRINDLELIDKSEELSNLLNQFLSHYEFVLQEHKIGLPY